MEGIGLLDSTDVQMAATVVIALATVGSAVFSWSVAQSNRRLARIEEGRASAEDPSFWITSIPADLKSRLSEDTVSFKIEVSNLGRSSAEIAAVHLLVTYPHSGKTGRFWLDFWDEGRPEEKNRGVIIPGGQRRVLEIERTGFRHMLPEEELPEYDVSLVVQPVRGDPSIYPLSELEWSEDDDILM